MKFLAESLATSRCSINISCLNFIQENPTFPAIVACVLVILVRQGSGGESDIDWESDVGWESELTGLVVEGFFGVFYRKDCLP